MRTTIALWRTARAYCARITVTTSQGTFSAVLRAGTARGALAKATVVQQLAGVRLLA